jgi:hypothetical protein
MRAGFGDGIAGKSIFFISRLLLYQKILAGRAENIQRDRWLQGGSNMPHIRGNQRGLAGANPLFLPADDQLQPAGNDLADLLMGMLMLRTTAPSSKVTCTSITLSPLKWRRRTPGTISTWGNSAQVTKVTSLITHSF